MCVCPSVSAQRVTPGKSATAGEAKVRPFSRVRPLVLRHRLVPRERRSAIVANIFLGLDVDVLLVLFHVAQL